MKLRLMSAALAISLLPAAATAQVTIDMGAFTCGPVSGDVADDVA